jgi:hypothetical protein
MARPQAALAAVFERGRRPDAKCQMESKQQMSDASTLKSVTVLQAFLNRTPADLAFRSNEFARALVRDFGALSDDPAAADRLFSSLGIPVLFESPASQILAWERVLSIVREADPSRYEAIHKGTPFYFLGIASYFGEDFERALFYMDCALEQDRRLHGPRWYRIPSGMFVRLDDIPEEQAGRELVRVTRSLFEVWGDAVAIAGGSKLSVEAYRARLVNYGIQHEQSLRSVVTALLSFLLEVTTRQKQLKLAPVGVGTGEPFFLHLFKGAVLFETLLRASPAGTQLLATNPRAALGDLLCAQPIFAALGFSAAPQGLGRHTFSDALEGIQADASADIGFHQRAVRAVWALRNTTGHNLAWPVRPDGPAYEQLFVLVLGSIMLAINNLYPDHWLETGTA